MDNQNTPEYLHKTLTQLQQYVRQINPVPSVQMQHGTNSPGGPLSCCAERSMRAQISQSRWKRRVTMRMPPAQTCGARVCSSRAREPFSPTRAHAFVLERARDRHVQADNEYSDSEDEGEGGRKDERSYRDELSSASAGRPSRMRDLAQLTRLDMEYGGGEGGSCSKDHVVCSHAHVSTGTPAQWLLVPATSIQMRVQRTQRRLLTHR
jgi:hypothetical protein